MPTLKNILIGVTGGIAAYKTLELVRLLKKRGLSVKVVMTQSAMAFIQPLSFATLSEQPVYTDTFNKDQSCCEHIQLARWPDLILIAPATANIMAKLSHGIADDLLSTICLAADKPLYLAPAMNKIMWQKDATQNNIKQLKVSGVTLLGPNSGEQACGDLGFGRMLEPEQILSAILAPEKTNPLTGKKIVITAGPTIEPLDPVRYLSNRSSGKMGYAIAQAALDCGAQVTLISGPTHLTPPNCQQVIAVNTAAEMHQTVMHNITDCDVFIGVAAVCDYRPDNYHNDKIKKQSHATLSLDLTKNPDILSDVAKLKSPPLVVGFAAETSHLVTHATDKLKTKKIDIIAANLVGENIGFDSDDNSLTLISQQQDTLILEKNSKQQLAHQLMQFIQQYHHNKTAVM